MSHLCPGAHDLSRMFQGEVDAPVPPSLASCATCHARWQGLVRTVRIVRALPVDLPSPARRDEVRAELLARASASPSPPLRRPLARLALPAVAGLVAAAALVRMATHPATVRSPVTVHDRQAARYEIATGPPDETLRLHDGTIGVEVAPLQSRERFRVLVGEDEVEVRGTSFEVTAAADRLMAVSVTRGHVEVRPRQGVAALLGAGQSWAPAPPEPPPPVSRPAAPPPPGSERHRPPRAPLSSNVPPLAARVHVGTRQAGAEELAYDDAWDAMRAGDFRRAAEGFGRVVALAPAGGLADEAAFWRAVAMARDGAPARAIGAFKQMLAGYPASPRRGEAAVILGWLLADAHQSSEAAALFRSAVNDPSEVVRTSARRGLEPPPPAPAGGGVPQTAKVVPSGGHQHPAGGTAPQRGLTTRMRLCCESVR